jgi:hypothetical protein
MRVRLLVLVALVAGAAGGYGVQALASAETQEAHGHLVSQVLSGPACTSPIGLCTAGRLEGTINGDFVFTATSLTPSSTPGVFFYTGEIVVQTSKGEVRCQDAGAYGLGQPSGPVVDICTITGGTGDWAGVTGHIRIHGTFTATEGGDSHYEGLITH